jgi:hypothetical protein
MEGDGLTREQVVSLNLIEIGWLMGQIIARGWAIKGDDPMARVVWRKLRAAAIAGGVEWRYGDPPWAKEAG